MTSTSDWSRYFEQSPRRHELRSLLAEWWDACGPGEASTDDNLNALTMMTEITLSGHPDEDTLIDALTWGHGADVSPELRAIARRMLAWAEAARRNA